jgi:hypothetical protein
MAETVLSGPFPLKAPEINSEITRKSPGVYMLDRSHDDGPFHISYVGRSDTDLNARLHEHGERYKRFKYEYHDSPEEAFARECRLYHQYNPPSTIVHPPRPVGTKWKCAECKVFG